MDLNYIWDQVVKAEQQGIAKSELRFVPAKVYSPYMEISREMLNDQSVERTVEINPYYRFHSIFKDLFDAENDHEEELRHTLFDLAIHFLAEIDLMQGMNKREYHIRFALRDMKAGVFGTSVSENIELFTKDEQEVIAGNVLRLYESGEAIYLLKDTLRKIFKQSTIYANCEEKDELLFYIGQPYSEQALAKIELIKDLFLPIRFQTELYWDRHFGVIDVDKTMQVDYIALY
ncbi:iron-dependent peroxidase [Paenibacillus arenosi]|uniref:Iron-dependent peroxidase n=1 Tax=Paenibacillus arenosi TaxID=2774142 RepID=A0ABR9AYN6_9BACL|nr:iron-dependent peroxidase [Paenibacillus arenosi]MBD8498803.1 iron-dependent peroxidase [Paenibacillus arenosi]